MLNLDGITHNQTAPTNNNNINPDTPNVSLELSEEELGSNISTITTSHPTFKKELTNEQAQERCTQLTQEIKMRECIVGFQKTCSKYNQETILTQEENALKKAKKELNLLQKMYNIDPTPQSPLSESVELGEFTIR